ncbi:ThiF family adenylyltransferase [Knoellia koreensis]|uniref:ThiF family adenylyltransferase n=1 Tax=Knoellia koreensis TaxID=2730921 RepID=A0A849HCT8_9MICO|nr:ThiF family adenylyltransferase [Knoellia sp. DB2414S]NNM45228.1 ThiF family adenylyltransferase [Knoellia sp. DB2414S]
MSQRRIARSPDLLRLHEDGYHLELRGDVLLVHGVPYANPSRQVVRGTLVTDLELAGDVTAQPSNHVAYFIGEAPSTKEGVLLTSVVIGSAPTDVGTVRVDHTMSKKPQSDGQRYRDYHHKVETYIALISIHAQQIDPEVTARTYPVIAPDPEEDDDSPFEYLDTSTTRNGLSDVSDKLRIGPVAILGLGGTGGYVLDLVAKTPVDAIHLWDGDRYVQHNAFRSPGAPSADTLATVPQKVTYFAAIYGNMRKRIVPHDAYLTEDNVEELREMSFVFVAVDDGPSRQVIITKLEEFGIPFIDVGLGIEAVDGSLLGQVRTTLSSPRQRAHVHDNRRIPFGRVDGVNDDYKRNIQIAPLNMLNAALAVTKWLKHLGYLTDLEREHHSVYVTSGNVIINEDQS